MPQPGERNAGGVVVEQRVAKNAVDMCVNVILCLPTRTV